MKEKIKKSTALLQVVVIISSLIILLFSVGTNESVAEFRDKTTKVNLHSGLRFFELYTETPMLSTGALTLQQVSNNRVNIKADKGTILYIESKGEVKPENPNDRKTPALIFKRCNVYYTTPSGNRIEFTKRDSEIKFEEVGQYVIVLQYYDKYEDCYISSINVQVAGNEIVPKQNAVKIDGIIYAKEENTAVLGTLLDNSKSERRGKFTTSSGYNSSGSYGEKIFSSFNAAQGTIVWSNNIGGQITGSIYRSNLSTGEYRLNGLNNAKISCVSESYNGLGITRRIGVKFGEKTVLQAIPTSVSPSVKAANCIKTIETIYTKSNRTGGMKTFRSGEDNAVIETTFSEPCLLKVEIEDYERHKFIEYWDIVESDNNIVINNDTTPVNGKDYSDDIGNGGTGNDGGGDYSPVESYNPGPTVSWWADWSYDKEMLNINVRTENSADTGYTIVKRTDNNVPSKTKNVRYTTYGLDNGKISINTQNYEEGLYDIIIYTSDNTNGNGWFDIITTEWMGGKYTVRQPKVTLKEKGKPDEVTGEVTYTYTMENCTAYKYKVIKRDDPNKAFDTETIKNEVYDGFDGTEVKLKDYGTKKDESITINPLETGSGTYDIVIYVINRAAQHDYRNIWYPIVSEKIEVSVNPTISFTYEKNSLKQKNIKVETKLFNNAEIEESYYRIYRNDRYVSKKYTAEEIKADNKSFKSGDVIEFNYDEMGAGWYTLACYVKDSKGGEKISQYSVPISKGVEINYTIQGEDKDSKSSLQPRYVQKIDVTATSELNDEINVQYVITSDDLVDENTGKINMDMLHDSKYKVESLAVKSGETVTISAKAEDNVTENKYIYIFGNPIGPNYTNGTAIRTGSLKLDGKPLALNSVYIENNGRISTNKKSFGIGQKLRIVAHFNHDIAPSGYRIPNLLIKVDDKIKVLEYEEITGSNVIYSTVIDESWQDGKITINDFKCFDPFVGKDAKEYTCKPNLKEDSWFDLVGDMDYLVDTVKPEVSSIEIQIDADENKILNDDENNIKYITDIKDAKVVINYSEEVSGRLTAVFLNKGDKAIVSANVQQNTERGLRTTDEFSIVDQLNEDTIKKFDGELKMHYIWNTGESLEDKAGNIFENPNKNEIAEKTLYVLNGKKVEDGKLIFDSSVYEPEIYVGNTRVEENMKYNKGTVFTAFAEFNSKENYEDISGIKDTVTFNIYYNEDNAVVVENKNGSKLINTEDTTYYETENSSKQGYDKVDKYTLNISQLPISFTLENEGKYFIEAEKQDKLGNKGTKEIQIETSELLVINKEMSGLLNIKDEDMHCFYDLDDDKEEKKYTLVLHSEDSKFEFSDLEVYIITSQGNRVPMAFAGAISNSNGTDGKYEFEIYKGGVYVIDVIKKMGKGKNDEEEYTNLLRDTIEVENVYIIGDVNHDGEIRPDDLIAMRRMVVGFIQKNRQNSYAGNVWKELDDDGNPVLDKETGYPEVDVSDIVMFARSFMGEVVIRQSDK